MQKLSPAQERGLAWCRWLSGSGPMVVETPSRATLQSLSRRGLISYEISVSYPRSATGHVSRRPVSQVQSVRVH